MLAQSPSTYSQPPDLDILDARLRAVFDGDDDSGPDARFADVFEGSSPEFDPETEKTRHERESY